MKSIEDKAKAYAEQYEERYQVAMFKAFLDGATEQKEIDDTLMSEERQKAFKIGYDIAVDEACKWVDDNVGTMTAIALRKAMEE